MRHNIRIDIFKEIHFVGTQNVNHNDESALNVFW